MDLEEYAGFDAVGLATLVRSGQVSDRELLECARSALELVNPEINAVIHMMNEPVVGDPTGPFAGVPFLVKDLVLHIKNVPHTMGSRLLKNNGYVSEADSELFSRFKGSGLVTIGVTNSPEFGFNPSAEPVAFGPTRNPFDLARSAGGSSGGSAAAIASGIVPLAHSNDGGGSIRIPASACGLVGLKPTRGRTPVGPDTGFPLMGLGIEFINSRTVRDSAHLLDCVEGPETGAVFDIPRPSSKYADVINQPTRKLKVAVSTKSPGSKPVAPFVEDAVLETARILEAQGHAVEHATPDYDATMFHDANFVAWVSFLSHAAEELCTAFRTEPNRDVFEATTLTCIEAGNSFSGNDIQNAFSQMNAINRIFGRFLTRYDAFLTPVSVGLVPKVGHFNQDDPDISARGWYDKIFLDCYPFTAQFNMTGQPAIVLPAGQQDGMPLSVQIAGAMGDEATLLQLARDLEEARPWDTFRPPIHAAAALNTDASVQ